MSENTKVHPATPMPVPILPAQHKLKTLITFNGEEFFVYDGNDPKEALVELYCWWGGRLERSIFKQAVSGITHLNDVISLLEACISDIDIDNIFCNCESVDIEK